MEEPQEPKFESKERHGCVTAWLVMMIVVNSITSCIYFFAGDKFTQHSPVKISSGMLIMIGILGVANVIFSIFLLKWRKLGFFGFVVTSLAALIINISLGLGPLSAIFGLLGVVLLYGILQIKQGNRSTWEQLE